jgi:hypothetical protein
VLCHTWRWWPCAPHCHVIPKLGDRALLSKPGLGSVAILRLASQRPLHGVQPVQYVSTDINWRSMLTKGDISSGERQYDPAMFHGRVRVFGMRTFAWAAWRGSEHSQHIFGTADHNVPTLRMLMDICKDVETFLASDARNVVAIHCKGGKGRTGTVISSYLVFSSIFRAREALDHFAQSRTEDATIGTAGVETPSQRRYVVYMENMCAAGRLVPRASSPAWPAQSLWLTLLLHTAPTALNLVSVEVFRVNAIGEGRGEALRFEIFSGGANILMRECWAVP